MEMHGFRRSFDFFIEGDAFFDFFGEDFGMSRDPAFVNAAGSPHGIGRSAPRHMGLEQSLGEKPFVADMAEPGMLHGAMVPTAHPRARVLKIRTDAAKAMPGVVRVLTAADVPGSRGTGLMDDVSGSNYGRRRRPIEHNRKEYDGKACHHAIPDVSDDEGRDDGLPESGRPNERRDDDE